VSVVVALAVSGVLMLLLMPTFADVSVAAAVLMLVDVVLFDAATALCTPVSKFAVAMLLFEP
jgi:hypothetical protein